MTPMRDRGLGKMPAVYKAYQAGVDRYVALKVLPRQLSEESQFIGRFEQEAKVLVGLQHPHILPVFDFGEEEGYTYIVMPLIEADTLADKLQGQPRSLDEIERIISQIGDALDYAHSKGLIHRDIKPSNILLDERGNCLLTDFGIAKIYEATAKFTKTGGLIGTPNYMSPEQGSGERVDRRTDIYSLGVVLYEMVTGQVPFRAETPVAVVLKHIQAPLPPPRTLNPSLPEAIERVVLKALAKNGEFSSTNRTRRATLSIRASTRIRLRNRRRRLGAALAPCGVTFRRFGTGWGTQRTRRGLSPVLCSSLKTGS